MIDRSRRAFATSLLALGAATTAPRLLGQAAVDDTLSPAPTAPPLRLGVTPVILDEQVGFLGRWADWLGARLQRRVVLVQRARYREILDLLLGGRLELAWICGYPYVRHQNRLELIVVPVWHGQPLYRSELIVAADSELDGLADLEDHLFAWADPDSNSGWLYPRFALAATGKDPERFFRRTFFTWGHPRSVLAVSEGLADGAAVDSYVRETLVRHSPALGQALRVVHRSPLFGFPPLVAGPAMSHPDRARTRDALLAQAEDGEGRALLADLNLDGFSVEGPGLFADIAAMAERLGRGSAA
jgi:phosphonate transport system substrate-binding protein